MSRLRVLVCGAGIGGNALALFLSQSKHFDITVVERDPKLRVNGLQVDLRGHGIEVIKRTGLESAVRAKCVPELGIQLVDSDGRRWAFMPANTTGKGAQLFTSEWEVMRGDLCQLLYDRARDHVTYKFGTYMTQYVDEPSGGVRVQFADGSSDTFDLIVGADGQHSRTRRLMFGPGASDGFNALAQHIAYCRVPMEAKPNEEFNATGYLAPGPHAILTRRHNPHQLQIYLIGGDMRERLETIGRNDVAAQREAYANEFRGIGWKADELMQSLLASDDFYCHQEGFVKLDRWSRGRVTLLGDAGYSPSTNGQGTSCALIGAYVLAGELIRHVEPVTGSSEKETASPSADGIERALEEYEHKLRPLVDIVQRGLEGQTTDKGFEWKAWHIRAIYWIAWAACALRVYKLASLFSDQGITGWTLPEYPELKLML